MPNGVEPEVGNARLLAERLHKLLTVPKGSLFPPVVLGAVIPVPKYPRMVVCSGGRQLTENTVQLARHPDSPRGQVPAFLLPGV